ncbi:pilus assembly protein [Arthrobacter sp. DNA4]|uniref:TadE/TadG family type IV pilus assembly protein n=1 Tax=Arthrobacter sp. DNA4 TaxID=2963432 RepID=UPI0020CBB861|nr:TadE/TadG family type IV pilus assembly protein [Arthrobacter sp. DNA4]UTT68504.1 pilus assembly protein [Arthrobacter sp. DNA4]
MRRLRNPRVKDSREHGAAGVVVAVMMLVLIGAGAMAVDVGQIYAERAQLQNGADAGALAVARSCDPGPCTASLAAPLANANSNDGSSDAVVDLSVAGKVTVTTSTRNGSNSFLAKMFASALNSSPVTVGATATATWGHPGSGPATLPITFAPCQFDVDGSLHTILVHGSQTCVSDNPSGAAVAGGFEWLSPDPGKCGTTVYPDDPATPGLTDPYAKTDTGLNMPSICKPVIESYLNKVVLIPVYSSVTGTGSNAKYYIKGFAAYLLVGYNFPGMSGGDLTGLGGSDKGIRGRFVSWVADPSLYGDGGYSGGGADLPPHLVK